jgi:hypothetical protein
MVRRGHLGGNDSASSSRAPDPGAISSEHQDAVLPLFRMRRKRGTGLRRAEVNAGSRRRRLRPRRRGEEALAFQSLRFCSFSRQQSPPHEPQAQQWQARHLPLRFRGSVCEFFRGNLSPALSPLPALRDGARVTRCGVLDPAFNSHATERQCVHSNVRSAHGSPQAVPGEASACLRGRSHVVVAKPRPSVGVDRESLARIYWYESAGGTLEQKGTKCTKK